MNQASLSGRLKLGLVDIMRMLPSGMHCAKSKVWWRRDDGLGLYCRVNSIHLMNDLTLMYRAKVLGT